VDFSLAVSFKFSSPHTIRNNFLMICIFMAMTTSLHYWHYDAMMIFSWQLTFFSFTLSHLDVKFILFFKLFYFFGIAVKIRNFLTNSFKFHHLLSLNKLRVFYKSFLCVKKVFSSFHDTQYSAREVNLRIFAQYWMKNFLLNIKSTPPCSVFHWQKVLSGFVALEGSVCIFVITRIIFTNTSKKGREFHYML
jgi:hypothetical protein